MTSSSSTARTFMSASVAIGIQPLLSGPIITRAISRLRAPLPKGYSELFVLARSREQIMHEVRSLSRRPNREPDLPQATLRREKGGFAINVRDAQPLHVTWGEIVEVRAFKMDL